MSITKIVIDDKLPTSCYICQLSCDKYDIGRLRCIPMNKAVDNYIETCPSWCPLVVEDVCEWKLIKSDDEDYRWRVFKNCKPDGKMLANGLSDRFCPICGKRIEYKEE